MDEIIEESLKKQLATGQALIQDALQLIHRMAQLKGSLCLKAGCGGRYIQHTRPSQTLLQRAGERLQHHYQRDSSDNTLDDSASPPGRSRLIQTLHRKGMA